MVECGFVSNANELEQLKDEEFTAEYEKLEPEFSIIQAVIDARKTNYFHDCCSCIYETS